MLSFLTRKDCTYSEFQPFSSSKDLHYFPPSQFPFPFPPEARHSEATKHAHPSLGWGLRCTSVPLCPWQGTVGTPCHCLSCFIRFLHEAPRGAWSPCLAAQSRRGDLGLHPLWWPTWPTLGWGDCLFLVSKLLCITSNLGVLLSMLHTLLSLSVSVLAPVLSGLTTWVHC